MKYLLYVFVGFWVLWIFWYLGGGPLRDDNSKAFVTPGQNGFEYVESTKDQNSQGIEQIKGILK